MPGDDASDDTELGNLLCVRVENREAAGDAETDDIERGDCGIEVEENGRCTDGSMICLSCSVVVFSKRRDKLGMFNSYLRDSELLAWS